ncbi:RNA polymerase sigma factor ShbA [Amycolatopsis sp. NEAU-NG30]|uniref:RNA polymerase sigma factor ShbA n=1 Tax=Amycolatopsis melonis TaxID=3156488 RepID=A0ABV0LIH2_9PSEU
MLPVEAPVDGYVVLEESPRPDGRLAKERLDPLVAAARTGDPDAVQALLRLVKPTVVRYCRARIGGRDLSYLSADDVAQEVCLAVLKVLPNYQDRGGSFLYLVRAIAANKVADAFRAVARDRAKPVPELPDHPLGGNEPEAHALELDLGVRLGRLLATLPRLHQEILALRVVGGLSATETAEALGISAGNVRITQYRALGKLRGMIGEGGL